MPKIKKRRLAIRIDMTPMVDVAFLLLTFFMLTTQFKPPQDVQIVLPASHSEFKLPEADVQTITITKDGSVYMGVDAQQLRKALKLTIKCNAKARPLSKPEKTPFSLKKQIPPALRTDQ